jgi:hypothetical protein
VRGNLVCAKRINPHTSGHSNTSESPIMFYALSWFFVVALLALWSLAAWALHAVAVWTVANAGALTGAASGAGTITAPDWLAPWVPSEVAQWASQLMAGLAPFVEGLLQAAPALAGGLTVATWVIWSIGSVLLVLLGVGLHLVIALLRRRGDGGSGPNAGPSLAAG